LAVGSGAASASAGHHHGGSKGGHHGRSHHHHGAGGAGSSSGATLYVAPPATPTTSVAAVTTVPATNPCNTAAFSTIGAAVTAASPGDTIIVCPGTYAEAVSIAKSLTLEGENATVDATGQNVGIQVTASNSTIEGFTVENATGEGILVGTVLPPVATASAVISVSNVTIVHDVVKDNDLGGAQASPTYPECMAAGGIPGDCGEGIHLDGAFDSTVAHNYVTGNSGGVLLSDEAGPTHDNVIEGNLVIDNLFDCGITFGAHNPNAYDIATGQTNPTVAGLYNNKVLGNVLIGNGSKGEGAGVLLAASGPGTATYDNLVSGNKLAGNELSGVTVHSHSPATVVNGNNVASDDINGNVVVHNAIYTNNTGSGDFPNGPTAAGDTATTGILVYSAFSPVAITIGGNRIIADTTGVWLTNNVTVTGLASNKFIGVGTNVVTSAP
jgi:parallel beta-helix repeat protein